MDKEWWFGILAIISLVTIWWQPMIFGVGFPMMVYQIIWTVTLAIWAALGLLK